MNIALAKPSITQMEIESVANVLKEGLPGTYVQEFEKAMAKYCGARYAIAVSSGTTGLFLALKAMRIGKGDRVATTPFSFCASTNAIYHVGANPFFIDIDRDTYNLDVKDLVKRAAGEGISAILPVDIFGNPFNSNRVQGLPTLIDSCESLGSKMDRPFDIAVYAFTRNKVLTMGEGGCIITNNKRIAEYCRMMRNQGRTETDTWLNSTYCGYNFRLSELQAAMGIAQLKRIDAIISRRRYLYENYLNKFNIHGILDNIRIQKHESNSIVSPFVFTIEVENRDRVMLYLKKQGIETRPYFPSIHLMPYMRKLGYKPGDFPVSEYVSSRTLALPFFVDITNGEMDYVVEKLKEAMKEA